MRHGMSSTTKKLQGTKTNTHKQLFGIVPGMGGVRMVDVLPFSCEKRKHIQRRSQENAGTIPGQSWDNPGTAP